MKNIKFILPITLSDGLHLPPQKAHAFGEELAGMYCFAAPYPHIAIDDFLPIELANEIFKNFPAEQLEGDKFYESDYSGLHKRQIFPIDCNGKVRNIFDLLNSASMLQFLEGLTTIQGLIAAPYFHGGGFHETRRGGKLGVHADLGTSSQSTLEYAYLFE